ncbi:MAG: cytochrome c3 family protein, partial [bacterium]
AATFDGTKDVTILNGNPYVFGSGNLQNYYGRQAIVLSRVADGGEYSYNGAKSSNRIDQFCGVCHGDFHGGAVTDVVGDGTDFVRHPTGVAKIPSFSNATSAANLKIYQTNAAQTAGADSPGCLTCHKAHGNNNPFALIYPSPTGADTTEEGDGAYKTLCKSCHGMGGSITPF